MQLRQELGRTASSVVSRVWITEEILSELSGIRVGQASPVKFQVSFVADVCAKLVQDCMVEAKKAKTSFSL